MTTYNPTGPGDINLPGSNASANFGDLYITNTSTKYNNFNGNGQQDTKNPGGGNGATYQVTNNSTASFNTFNLNGANVIVDAGSAIVVRSDFTNAYGGHVTLNGSMTVGNNANLNTAQITVNSGGSFTAQRLTNLNKADVIINGGTVNLQGNLANNNGVVFDFNKNPNGTLIIAGPNEEDDMETVNIKNYVYGGTIKINYDNDLSTSANLTTSYDAANHALTIYSNGKSLLVLEDFYEADKLKPEATTQVINGDVYLVLTCFLADTQIETSSGAVAVQDLSVGDEIIAYVDGVATPRSVTWAGQARCTVRPHLPLDQAGYPVRIVKDAIAHGVPSKDLLVTAEHCLFFDGKFVPARMLVNGRSVFYDTSITSYDYYHVETEDHSVIMADGMLTESYLDTGNRRSFTQIGNVVSFTPSRNLTWNDAAAPLAVSREIVEPIFRRIEARAERHAWPVHLEAGALTHDHDLHLVTETGATIRQIRENDGRAMFMIPAGVENVWIVSNASRPCDVVGPFLDDRRRLGVLVGEVMLFEGKITTTLTDHLHQADLSGWSTVEDGTMRWTDGHALLNLGTRPIGSIALMAIQVHAAGPYLLEESVSERTAIQA